MRTLALVVPVYNAPALARRALAALPGLERAAAASGFSLVRALFIDDASSPPLDLPGAPPSVTVLRNGTNRGKGFSVRRGALAAGADWVLMSDVDMSAPFSEFPELAARADNAWMVCASRRDRAGMPFVRRVLSRLFRVCARLAGARGVRDTQCGFKLFRMDKMRPVFEAQRIERFAFDVELVRRVQRRGGSVVEAPVLWRGGARSSLRVARDAPRMLFDLLRLRFFRL